MLFLPPQQFSDELRTGKDGGKVKAKGEYGRGMQSRRGSIKQPKRHCATTLSTLLLANSYLCHCQFHPLLVNAQLTPHHPSVTLSMSQNIQRELHVSDPLVTFNN